MPLSNLTAKANTGTGTDVLATVTTANGLAGAVAVVDDTGNLITASNPLTVGLTAAQITALTNTSNDTAATGSLGALNATVVLNANGVGTSIFEFTGTWVGTVTFEGSNNNFATSQSIAAVFLGGIQTQSSTLTTNGYYSVITAGFAKVRARMSAYTSGSATVLANGSSADRVVVPVQGNPNNNQTLATLNSGTNTIGTVNTTSTIDTTATGSLTALNSTVALNTNGIGTSIFEITGTWVGTITFEGSNNNFTTSQSITAIFLGAIQTQSANVTANGYYSVVTAGFAKVQARMSAYTSGTATILANGSSADRIVVPLQGNPNNNQALVTPSGIYASTVTPVTASSGNVAAATATATIAAVAAKNNYLTGFEITSGGATAASLVTATITGLLGGTASYTYGCVAGVAVGNTPLIVTFIPPLISSAVNTAIAVSLPSLGAGNTKATVVAHGYTI